MSDNRAMQYAEILSKLIKIETISSRDNKDITKFQEFHKALRETFPNVFATAECEEFGGSLLLKWKGTDSSLDPVMLMNHHDVVEASGEWTHPAFSGEIADGRKDNPSCRCFTLIQVLPIHGESFLRLRR